MRVLLADDQVWLRSAIRLLLEEETDVREIDEAGDLRGLLQKVKATVPDLILLDWELPGLKTIKAGRELIASLRGLSPRATIIVLSGRPEASQRALDAGADAFVSKADPPDILLHLVRNAATRPGPQEIPTNGHTE